MRDPLILPFLSGVAGVVLAVALSLQPAVAGCALLVCTSLYFISLKFAAGFPKRVLALATAGMCGCLTAALHAPQRPPIIDFAPGEILLVSGCVIEPPTFSEDREQFLVELEPGARMRVSAIQRGEAPLPRLVYGQNIEFPARLRKPRNFGNPGAFDYESYLARRDTFWLATVSDASLIQTLPGRCGSQWRAWMYGLRQTALDRLDSLYASDAYKRGMMRALLIGDSSSLQAVWTEHFRRTGTYHALVISGAHISVLAGTFLFLFRLCRLPVLPSLVATAALAWVYAIVAGGEAPVVRSAAGFTVYLGCRFFFRRVRILNLLAVVGWAYLLADPYQIFEASFQLSFLSVAALGAFAVPIAERTTGLYAGGLRGINDRGLDARLEPRIAAWRVELRLLAETIDLWTHIPSRVLLECSAALGRIALFAVELALVSALVQAALALPMIAYFHRLSISGLSANVLATPVLTLAVPIGFLAILTGWGQPAWIAGQMLAFSQQVVAWHARIEPNWRVPDPPLWLSILFAVAVLLTAWAIRRRSKWGWGAAGASLAAIALIVVHPFPPQTQPGWLEMTAIDVGQGESLLIAFPDSQTMLVDGGGLPVFGKQRKPRIDIGEDVVSPYLWSRGIQRLGVVVLSHAHEDHSGGLPAIIRNFRPREVWTGPRVDCPEWARVTEAAREVGSRIVHLRPGATQSMGRVTIEPLAPLETYQAGIAARNEDSLVLSVSYGRRTILLTGDTDRRTLMELAELGRLQKVDILKAAHHGSKTSNDDAWLSTFRPEFTLISAGFQNAYRLPNPAVVASLQSIHSRILRTDLSGAVTIRTDGDRIETPGNRSKALFGLRDPF